MVSKALLLVGLFAVLLVVSEVATASETQSDTVKSESEEILHPDQQSYGGFGGHGIPGGKGYKSHPHHCVCVVILAVFIINCL